MAGSEVAIPVVGENGYVIVRIGAPWAINNDEDNANTSAVECKAAPARAGEALYMTHLTLSNNVPLADQAIVIMDDDGTIYFGPIVLMVEGDNVFSKDFKCPVKFADNKGIFVQELIGGKASALTIYLEGFTGCKPIS